EIEPDRPGLRQWRRNTGRRPRALDAGPGRDGRRGLAGLRLATPQACPSARQPGGSQRPAPGSTFTSNSAVNDGSGIKNVGTLTQSGNTFTGNSPNDVFRFSLRGAPLGSRETSLAPAGARRRSPARECKSVSVLFTTIKRTDTDCSPGTVLTARRKRCPCL